MTRFASKLPTTPQTPPAAGPLHDGTLWGRNRRQLAQCVVDGLGGYNPPLLLGANRAVLTRHGVPQDVLAALDQRSGAPRLQDLASALCEREGASFFLDPNRLDLLRSVTRGLAERCDRDVLVAPGEAPSHDPARQTPNAVDLPKPQVEAAASRGIKTLSVPGELQTPGIKMQPLDALDLLWNGKLSVWLPLRPGESIGPWYGKQTAPDETWLELGFTVVDGCLADGHLVRAVTPDPEHPDSEGRPGWKQAALWGPRYARWIAGAGFLNAGGFRGIRKHKGEILLSAPPVCDRPITERLLGSKTKVPPSPREFFSLLLAGSSPPGKTPQPEQSQLAPSLTVGSTRLLGPPTAADQAIQKPSENEDGNKDTKKDEPDPSAELRQAVDLSRMRLDFDGTSRSGRLSVGEDSYIDLRAGSRVFVKNADLRQMSLGVDGHIGPVHLGAGRSAWKVTEGGDGRFDVRLVTGTTSKGDPDITNPTDVDVRFHSLSVRGIEITAPAGDRLMHKVKLARLSTGAETSATENDAVAVVQYHSWGAPGNSRLRVDLPETSFDGIQAEVHVKGTKGNPGVLTLGDADAPMGIRGGLQMYSAPGASDLVLTGKLDKCSAQLAGVDQTGVLGLVAADSFELGARRLGLTGSGDIRVSQPLGQDAAALRLTTAAGEPPWQMRLSGCEGHVGSEDLPIEAWVYDVREPSTGGLLELSRLEIDTAGHPVLEGSGELAVAVRSLSFRGEQGEVVDLTSGSTGVLRLDNVGWNEHDPYPHVDATLTLQVGGKVSFTAERIKTLEGAGINVEIGPGGTKLILKVDLDGTGALLGQTRIDLKTATIKTRVDKVDRNDPPQLRRPPRASTADSLPRRRSPGLRNIREIEPLDVSDALRKARENALSVSDLPSVAFAPDIRPALRALKSAAIDATVPVQTLRGEKITQWEGRLWTTDVLLSTQPDTQAKLHFEAADGQVHSGRVELSQPLHIQAGSLSADIGSMELKLDRQSGAFHVVPNTTVDVFGLKCGLPRWVCDIAGQRLMNGLLGSPKPPTDLSHFFELLCARYEGVEDAMRVTYRPAPAPARGASTTKAQSARSVGGASADADPSANGGAVPDLVDFTNATLNVDETQFVPFVLPLGSGQYVSCGAATELTVERVPGKTTVTGVIDLAPAGQAGALLGGHALHVRGEQGREVLLDQGRARLHVVQTDGNPPDYDVTLGAIAPGAPLEVRGLRLRGPVGGATPDVCLEQVKGGTIRIRKHGDSNTVDVSLPGLASGTKAKITSEGVINADGTVAGADRLDAAVELASLRLKDGALRADLSDVRLDGRRMLFAAPSGEVTAGTLLGLRGQGQLDVRSDGSYALRLEPRPEDGLHIGQLDLVLPDGSRTAFVDGTAESIVIAQQSHTEGRPCTLEVRGADARSLQMAMALESSVEGDTGGGVRQIQVRDGHLQEGNLKLDGAEVSLNGHIEELNASLLDVSANSEVNDFDAKQIDLRGSADLQVSPQAVTLEQARPRSLSAMGKLRRFHLRTQAPELDLEVAQTGAPKNGRGQAPYLEGDVRKVHIGEKAVELEFADAFLRGNLSHGTVTVGAEDAALSKLDLDRGEVDVEVDRVRVVATDETEGSDFEFRGKIRVDGHVQDDLTTKGYDPADAVLSDDMRKTIQEAGVSGRIDTLRVEADVLLTIDAWMKNEQALVESAAEIVKGGVKMQFPATLAKPNGASSPQGRQAVLPRPASEPMLAALARPR